MSGHVYLLTASDGTTRTETSERAARAAARRMLGVSRVEEHPELNGWAYWPVAGEEDSPCVRCAPRAKEVQP